MPACVSLTQYGLAYLSAGQEPGAPSRPPRSQALGARAVPCPSLALSVHSPVLLTCAAFSMAGMPVMDVHGFHFSAQVQPRMSPLPNQNQSPWQRSDQGLVVCAFLFQRWPRAWCGTGYPGTPLAHHAWLARPSGALGSPLLPPSCACQSPMPPFLLAMCAHGNRMGRGHTQGTQQGPPRACRWQSTLLPHPPPPLAPSLLA